MLSEDTSLDFFVFDEKNKDLILYSGRYINLGNNTYPLCDNTQYESDQVYQFSRIYWKFVKQQNLPITIKYPGMVTQIAPHFAGGNIPPNIGKNNLFQAV